MDDWDLLDAGDCVHLGARNKSAWCLPSIYVIGAMKGATQEISTWLGEAELVRVAEHEV